MDRQTYRLSTFPVLPLLAASLSPFGAGEGRKDAVEFRVVI